MHKKTAGLLVYRWRGRSDVEVFLAHPGGPFYANKEYGCWTIPKGEFDNEEPLNAAIREFREETGQVITGDFRKLPVFKVTRSKVLHAFAVEGEADPLHIKSNEFDLEWPPKSGETRSYPEIDRAGWFTLREAVDKMVKGQCPLLDSLASELNLSRSVLST